MVFDAHMGGIRKQDFVLLQQLMIIPALNKRDLILSIFLRVIVLMQLLLLLLHQNHHCIALKSKKPIHRRMFMKIATLFMLFSPVQPLLPQLDDDEETGDATLLPLAATAPRLVQHSVSEQAAVLNDLIKIHSAEASLLFIGMRVPDGASGPQVCTF